MPTKFETLVPDHEPLLELEPEELAGFILECLNTLPERHRDLNSHNFCLQIDNSKYPRQSHKDIKEALMEAWTWLEREGLIAPRPGAAEGKWVFVTRRGKTLQQASDLKRYHKSNILPKQFLHPILAQKVWHLFVRGDYDTAIFQALKAVEVAVRKAAGFPVESIGTDLMRKSFHPESGPLVDSCTASE